MEIPDCRHFPGVGKKIIFLSVETMKKKKQLLPPGVEQEIFSV